ncbi:MAG: hypothetical protein OXH00_21195 [Candidatus Poribacteria bacterium]|nr:hypothetical protein [Candidatus Poribacteria bacterium]
MKARKTLLFMLWNPTTFIVYFLACWILFSAILTIWDEPFRYGTWPYVVAAAEGAFEDLPGSLWKLVTAFSFIIEEISRDFIFSYRLCLFIIPIALTFSYREARSSRKGITTERQTWMQWYDRQELIKVQRGTYETPPLLEHIPGGSYFISARKTVLFMFRHLVLPAGHFIFWFTLFALPTLFDPSDFVRSLPEIVILTVIFTLILSYREARSNLKGVAIERDIWTKWYYRQIKAIVQESSFEEPPASENVRDYSYIGEIPETLFFMVRNLKPFIIHLTCWIFTCALLFFTTLPPSETPEDIFEIFEIIGFFGQLLLWIFLIVFVISYREARGNLRGVTNAQQVWMQWYQGQQETVNRGEIFEEPPPLENTQANSYFRIAQKAILLMLLNPTRLMIHFIFWVLIVIFFFGEIGSSMPILLVFIPILISSYQEARGTVKGTAKEGEIWTKWYQRQTEAKAQGYTLAELPPSLNAG